MDSHRIFRSCRNKRILCLYIVFCFKSFCGIENLDAAGRTVRDYSGWNLSLTVPYMIDESLIKQIHIQKFVYPSDIEQEIIHKINAGNLDMVEKDIQNFVAYVLRTGV